MCFRFLPYIRCYDCTNVLLFHETGRMCAAKIAVFIRKSKRIQLARNMKAQTERCVVKRRYVKIAEVHFVRGTVAVKFLRSCQKCAVS